MMGAMEGTDRHILALLARDGRMSYTDLGRETGLSTSAAQQRVRRLEQRGAITGYHAELEPAAVGRTLTAFIAIRPADSTAEGHTQALLAGMPEVVSCYSVAGDASYLCLVAVESTRALDELLTRLRTQANVMTTTTVVLTTLFQDRPLVAWPEAAA